MVAIQTYAKPEVAHHGDITAEAQEFVEKIKQVGPLGGGRLPEAANQRWFDIVDQEIKHILRRNSSIVGHSITMQELKLWALRYQTVIPLKDLPPGAAFSSIPQEVRRLSEDWEVIKIFDTVLLLCQMSPDTDGTGAAIEAAVAVGVLFHEGEEFFGAESSQLFLLAQWAPQEELLLSARSLWEGQNSYYETLAAREQGSAFWRTACMVAPLAWLLYEAISRFEIEPRGVAAVLPLLLAIVAFSIFISWLVTGGVRTTAQLLGFGPARAWLRNFKENFPQPPA